MFLDMPNAEISKMSPKAAANIVGAHAGAHWTTQLTRASDRVEPYVARHAYMGRRRKPSTLLDKGGKALVKARTKASEVVRVASYDVSNLNDKDKFVREVATGQGIIRKSYVPGVGWKPATQLTRIQRAKVPGAQAKMRGMSRTDKRFKQSINASIETEKTMSPGMRVDRDTFGPEMGFTIRHGSAKRGRSTIYGQSASNKNAQLIMRHENVHAAPKRSSYRLHQQIARNPEKLMREEARADHYGKGRPVAQTKWGRDSNYAVAAQYRAKSMKRPNHPAKDSTQHAAIMGVRPTNRQVYEGAKQSVVNTFPHYRLNGPRGDRAIDAYAGLRAKLAGLPKKDKR